MLVTAPQRSYTPHRGTPAVIVPARRICTMRVSVGRCTRSDIRDAMISASTWLAAGGEVKGVFMSVQQPDRGETAAPDGDARVLDPVDAPEVPVVPRARAVPRTRWGAAWVGVCAAALTLVALIVLMVQNTRRVEVTFLWMHGTLPVALALLIAGVGSAILAMVFGAARITQLHRLVRRRRD
jgi:putative membrane protein